MDGDGATRLSSAEQATAARLQDLPQFAGRRFTVSPDIGAEYVDDLDRRYDAVGAPEAAEYWNRGLFLRSIDRHVLKSNDFTVIDMTGFRQDQIAVVRAHVDALPNEIQARILRIGF